MVTTTPRLRMQRMSAPISSTTIARTSMIRLIENCMRFSTMETLTPLSRPRSSLTSRSSSTHMRARTSVSSGLKVAKPNAPLAVMARPTPSPLGSCAMREATSKATRQLGFRTAVSMWSICKATMAASSLTTSHCWASKALPLRLSPPTLLLPLVLVSAFLEVSVLSLLARGARKWMPSTVPELVDKFSKCKRL